MNLNEQEPIAYPPIGWFGFDFDETLVGPTLEPWPAFGHPIPAMVQIVKNLLAQGVECRIVTARVCRLQSQEQTDMQRKMIEDWCAVQFGRKLKVTNEKDYNMWALFDDRAISVGKNMGKIECSREHLERLGIII